MGLIIVLLIFVFRIDLRCEILLVLYKSSLRLGIAGTESVLSVKVLEIVNVHEFTLLHGSSVS